VGARPVEQKEGPDKGIDGRIYFHVGDTKSHSIILSVKAGHVTVSQVRDLLGVLGREKAEIGVLISFEEPTGPMRKVAASAGFYTSPWGKHARLQLLRVEDLLTGKGIDRPPIQTSTTFQTRAEGAGEISCRAETRICRRCGRSRRAVLAMPDRFGLQKVVDGRMGERFIIVLLEGTGRVAESSKPLSASDARRALHKMGHSDAIIDAMFDRAREERSD
jgi:hypothetical protein